MKNNKNTRLTQDQNTYVSWNPPSGVTLRDYFAAASIGQLITEQTIFEAAKEANQPVSHVVASIAYDIADAMIKLRDVKP